MASFEAMTDHITYIYGLLAEVFRGNARRSVHSPRHRLIILTLAGRRDTRSKWAMTKTPDRGWWHRHTSFRLFGRNLWLHGQ